MIANDKDFQQKVRNRAISIEETAINKVKCHRLPGFVASQNKTIQLLHKRVLTEAKLLNEKYTDQFKRAFLGCNKYERSIIQKYLRRYKNSDVTTKEICYRAFMSNINISDRLKCIIRGYVDNDMETGILLDLHGLRYIDNNSIESFEGICYWVIKGKTQRCVEMKDNKDAYIKMMNSPKNSLLFMHNHPSTGTFSAEDFKMFCNNDSIYAMTVVGNDGGIYVLIKNIGFNPSNALRVYGSLVTGKYMNSKINATLAMRDILNNSNKYSLIYLKKGR